jgi:hypothetical protein
LIHWYLTFWSINLLGSSQKSAIEKRKDRRMMSRQRQRDSS